MKLKLKNFCQIIESFAEIAIDKFLSMWPVEYQETLLPSS